MPNYSSPSAAHKPSHGGYPEPREDARPKVCVCSSGFLGFPVHRDGCPAGDAR